MERLLRWSLVALLAACGPSPTEAQYAAPASAPPVVSAPPAASPSAPPPLRPAEARVPVRDGDARWGSDQAPVTIVVFDAVGWPEQGRAAALLDGVQRTYGEDKVRVVWKGFAGDTGPSFKQAQVVAGVASVGNGAVVRKFLALTRERPRDAFRIESLMDLAREAGVTDVASLEKRITADAFAPLVRDNKALADQLDVHAFGTLFVNGYRISGRFKKSALDAVVAEELKQTGELLTRGVSLADAYAQRTRANAAQAQDFPPRRPDLDTKQHYRVALGASPVQGDAKAPVTLVIFGAYYEPFTRRTQPVIRALQKRYGKDLRVVWKNAPLPGGVQPLSEPLALVSWQLRADGGDAAFWRAHERLLDEKTWQPFRLESGKPDPLGTPELRTTALEKLSADLGVKKGKEPSDAARQALAADMHQASLLNVMGRPTYFINGRPIIGSQKEDTFREVIDEELAAAKKKIADGVKPEQVYDTLMAPLPEPTDD